MIIILFQELKIEDKNILDPYFQLNYHENSHLNFTNLFMWRKPYHIEWCIEEDILFFIAEYNEEKFALQPLCTEDKFFMAIDKIRAYFAEQNLPLVFSGLEEMAVEKLKEYPAGEFEFEDNRDDYDYVYNSADLIKLAGRKFHSKKNHLNSFRKNYPEAKYLPINDDIITYNN